MQNSFAKHLANIKTEVDNISLLSTMAEASIEQNKFDNYWEIYPLFKMLQGSCKKITCNLKKIKL